MWRSTLKAAGSRAAAVSRAAAAAAKGFKEAKRLKGVKLVIKAFNKEGGSRVAAAAGKAFNKEGGRLARDAPKAKAGRRR